MGKKDKDGQRKRMREGKATREIERYKEREIK
jgi:hypothetical protein